MKNNIQTKSIQLSPSGTHNLLKSTHPTPTSDPNFPQTLSSIGTDIRTDLNITWHSIQDIIQQQQPNQYKNKNYSQRITDLKTIEYCNKSITQCLLILNWFVQHKFIQIFCQRVVSKIRVYQFVGCRDGVLEKFWVNSKVPVKDGRVLFADIDDGAVFPALFQKCMAKIYGSYQQIPDNLVKLLQLWTCYGLQSLTPKQHTPRQLIQFFQNSHKNKNLVLYRTRNSIRLEQVGIENNSWFIIVRILKINIYEHQINQIQLKNQQNHDHDHDNGEKKKDIIQDIVLAQFLEFNGCKWNGKYSKNSQFWRQNSKLAIKNKINTNPHSLQNYITFSDLLSISRQICILHNTQHYNTNWYSSQSSQSSSKTSNDWISPVPQIFSINLGFLPDLSPTIGHKKYHTIISIHFEENCRNWVYLIQEDNCQLVSFCFKEKKETNFIIAMLEVGVNYLLFVRTYTRPTNQKNMKINVTVYCEGSWAEIKEVQGNTWVEEKAFMGMLGELKMVETQLGKDGQIRVGNMYREMGLGFIVINLKPQFNMQVFIQLNSSILKQQKMLLLCPKQPPTPKLIYNSPCHAILVFMLASTYKEGDKFPAQNSIKVWIQPQILTNAHININTNINGHTKLNTIDVNSFSYQ